MKNKIKVGLPDKDETSLFSMKCQYTQENDCCAPVTDSLQELEIWVEDGGGGPYICFKTDRYAISNIDELVNIFKDFNSRLHGK